MTNTKLLLATLTAVAGLTAGIILAPQLTRSSLAEDSPKPHFKGRHFGAKFANSETWQNLQDAMDNLDYDAWQQARQQRQAEMQEACQNRFEHMDDLIDSQEDFEKWVQIRNLKQEGKYEEAKVLWQELGFELPDGFGPKMGRHWSKQ